MKNTAGRFHRRRVVGTALQAHRAHADLRESAAFCRSIIESSPDCIKVLDLEGNLLSMYNGQDLLGIEDIRPYLNKSWIEFWHGVDRAAARAAIEAAKTGGKASFVGFFRTLRGEPKWWDVSVAPILNANAPPTRLLVVSRDVTQRRHAEMNLTLLASVSQDLVHWADRDGMMRAVGAQLGAHLALSLCAFVEVNEAADEVVIAQDWHRDDVPGLVGTYRAADFVGVEFIRMGRAGQTIVVCDVATDARTDAAAFAAMKIAAFICVPLIRDGQWRFALCLYRSERCIWRADEITLAVEVTARVWTRLERLRAEAALRQSERRYRTLFESIDEGFCIIEKVLTAAGEPVDFRVVEANPAAVRQTGVSALVGKTLREQFPSTFEAWYAVYETVLQTGQPTRLEREVQDIGRVVEAYVFRIEHDTAARVALVFKDITARTRAEQALRTSAQTMVDLDRRKDEFLAMLCHELRNPLAPISNAVHLLRRQERDDPRQHQAINIIDRQVRQLTHLVDELLDISRINTGRVQLRRQTIALSHIVERALETARPLIDQRGHELSVSLAPQPVWLNADPFRLEQVVVNLLTNAAKYTDEGGRIELSVEQEGDAVAMRVRDTGIGIASELLPHIFDLFTQAQRSLDRSQGGLGIGLSLVQLLVELHGGTVQAHSVPGHGSEFVVRLPVLLDFTPPAPAPLPAALTAPLPGPGCRVLVVDDNLDLARSLTLLLQMSGHQVRMVHDGPSAVEAALDGRPDVVLLDIGLPGFDGFEVAQRMRRHPGLQGVVLVAMTGYGQAADRQRPHEAGFDHHLVKPADFDEVQNILATVSHRGAGEPPNSEPVKAARSL